MITSKIRGLVFITLIVSLALSQPKNDAWHCPGPEQNPQMHKQMRQLRKWRLIEELNLTDDQSDQFLPILNKFEKEIELLDRQLDTLSHEIAEFDFSIEHQESFDLKKSSELIDKVEKLKEDKWQLEADYQAQCRNILDSRQHLLLISFDHRFRNEMRHMLKNFMNDKREPNNSRKPRKPMGN